MQDNAEIEKVTEKIKTFMAGTTWGAITVYFRQGKITKYEEIKTEVSEEEKRKQKT